MGKKIFYHKYKENPHSYSKFLQTCNKILQFFNLQKVAMVERVRSINLHREDREPRLRSRHYIYRNIENPNPPPTEIEVLLIDNVDGKDLSL